jgi:hypothetical protein
MLYAIPRKISGGIPDIDPVTIEEKGGVVMVTLDILRVVYLAVGYRWVNGEYWYRIAYRVQK